MVMLLGRVSFLGYFLATAALLSAAADAARLATARALYRERGKSLEAQKAFETIAAADPTNPQAQLFLGRLALRRDDTQAAVSHLEQAVELAPADGEAHKALGDAYGRSAQKAAIFSRLGFAKKCLSSYEKAVALAPERVEFRQSLFEYYRQAPGFAGGSREKAVEQATAIKRLDAAAGRLAFAALHTGEENYAAALAQFDEVLATSPDDYNALYQVGRLAALTGHYLDRGAASLRRCLQVTPPAAVGTPGHAAVHWRLGMVFEKQGDRAAAREAYGAALRIDPGFASAAEALRRVHE